MIQKTLIITFNNDINDLTLPNLKNYANRINSDLLTIDDTESFFSYSKYLYEYERVAFISPYILVRHDTPNLFDIVPKEKLGLFNEGRYTHRETHFKTALQLYNESLNSSWPGTYYNFDVMIFSKCHRELFTMPTYDIVDISSYFNIKIHNEEIPVFNLHYNFNRIDFLDAQIGISRFDSYMINYVNAPHESVRSIIQSDIKHLECNPNAEYKRNIVIRLSAGLGDQIESEPVARFIRKIYPNDNIYLTTHHPRIFKHLEKEGIKVFDYNNWKGVNDACIIMENNPESTANGLTQVLFHPTDYSSISMIRRTLPNIDKQIQIAVYPEDVESVLHLLNEKSEDKEIIIVHPGKWWPSKTFPISWWQKVIDMLSEKLTVVLIGKTLSENQGFLDVDCPIDGFDFRDFTSLGENIALISLSRVTLSNDSSPIHIAGAFDNWIVTIPTAKHQDHIFPFRKGTQSYKTIALNNKLLQDDLEVRHTEFYFDTIDALPSNKIIDDYLPTPEEVVNEIFNIYKKIDKNEF